MSKYALEVADLHFAYAETPVIEGLDLTIEEGELLALVGENGSGKSTLVKLILASLEPDQGSIKLLGEEVTRTRSYEHVGYVPQKQILDQIVFPITCLELLCSSQYRQMGLPKIASKEQVKRAEGILERFGLSRYTRMPFNELSGGLQQRVMIARAMLTEPQILILDEPTAGVDQANKNLFMETLAELNAEGLSMLLVTHELELTMEKLGLERYARINEGKIEYHYV